MSCARLASEIIVELVLNLSGYDCITNSVSDDCVSEIVGAASGLNVKTFDFGILSNISSTPVKHSLVDGFRFFVNFPQGLEIGDIEEYVDLCISRLRGSCLHAVFFDSQDELLAYEFDERLIKILQLRQKGKLNNIGVVVRNLNTIFTLLSEPAFSIIQVSLNVLDNRSSDMIFKLKARRPDLSIYVNSPFLEGALLANPTSLPLHLPILQAEVDWFLNYCEDIHLNPGVVALKHLHNHPIDGVVANVDTAMQVIQVSSWLAMTRTIDLCLPQRPFHPQFDPVNW